MLYEREVHDFVSCNAHINFQSLHNMYAVKKKGYEKSP